VFTKIQSTITVKKDQTQNFADQTLNSHIVVEEGGTLILKNVLVNGDLDNKGDVKTQGNVVFNAKVRTKNKIIILKNHL